MSYSSSVGSIWTHILSSLSLLLIVTQMTSQQSGIGGGIPSVSECQILLGSNVCRDLAGRNTNYTYPFFVLEVDDFLISTVMRLLQADGISNECTDFMVHLTCLTWYPCSPETGLPLNFCEESCDIFDWIQATGFCQDLIDSIQKFTMGNEMFMRFDDLFLDFDCNGIRNFSVYDPDNCTNLFSPDIQASLLPILNGSVSITTSQVTQNESTTSQSVLIVAVILPLVFIFGVVAFIFIFGCTCYIRRRRKTSRLVKSAEYALSRMAQKSSASRPYFKQLSKISLPYGALEMGEEIGRGFFGKVFKGKYFKSGTYNEVAIKTLKNVASDSRLEELLSEGVIMKDFHHPNVLGLLGVVFDTPDDVPCLVLPFMKNGNLKDYLKSRRVVASDFNTLPQDLQLSDITKMCVDIVQGMEYLAGNRFVHRDLAARNCMLNEDLVVKVGDFGFARDVYANDYYQVSDNRSVKLPVKWMAPESFNDRISTEKTDVWSFGVTCWEVFSLGRTPYPAIVNCDVFNHISSGRRLEKPSLCPEDMFAILKTCWEYGPEDRPSFTQLTETLVEYWEQEYGYVL